MNKLQNYLNIRVLDLAESCDCPVKCENVDYTVISTSTKLIIGDFVTSAFM